MSLIWLAATLLHRERAVKRRFFESKLQKSALERLQESLVRRELLQPLEQHFHGGHRIGAGKRAPQRVYFRKYLLRQEFLLLARPGLSDVHGREDAPLEQTPVEHDLRVSGSLELLENHFVHSRSRIDQR